MHFVYELEWQEEDEEVEEGEEEVEVEECAAAAAAAEEHAHPATRNVEPEAVATSSEPLPSVCSLFDYGRRNWVSLLRKIWTEPVSHDISLSHCVTNRQRGSWRGGRQCQLCHKLVSRKFKPAGKTGFQTLTLPEP